MNDHLHTRILKYLSACPPAIAGQGGHNQTFNVACKLWNGFGLSIDETIKYLHDYNLRCQPPWEEKDLVHKANEAAKVHHKLERGHLVAGNGTFKKEDFKPSHFENSAPDQRPAPVVIDPTTAIEVFLKGFKCEETDLWEASPVKPSEDWTQDGCLLVQHLFNVGEIVNYVTEFRMTEHKDGALKSVPFGYGESVERNELLDLWSLGMPSSDCGGWMRMNPMDGQGVGDKSVTSYRHILLEFDSIPLDLQLCLFARIPLPIACIMTSGGKSLHAWVRSDSSDAIGYKDDAAMLLKMLSRFGLDAKNKNPSRLSRLPGVLRRHGATGDGRQRLLYLNPKPEQRPIL